MAKVREPPLQWLEDDGQQVLTSLVRMVLLVVVGVIGVTVVVLQVVGQVLVAGLTATATALQQPSRLTNRRSRGIPALPRPRQSHQPRVSRKVHAEHCGCGCSTRWCCEPLQQRR
jgi:hypothetical protein